MGLWAIFCVLAYDTGVIFKVFSNLNLSKSHKQSERGTAFES